ncbi:MAG: WD40 repeat domain-containing protein [Gemmataceae bacterium]
MSWRSVPLLLALLAVVPGGLPRAGLEPVPAFQPAVALPAPPDAAPKPLLTFGGTRFRHTGYVTGLAFHPDGKTIAASADGEHFIRVWDAATGNEVKRLFGWLFEKADHPTLAPRVVGYSADSKRLVVAGPNRTVQILDPEAERRVAELVVCDVTPPSPVAVSPDGTRVATLGREGGLTVWDTGTGKELRTFAAVKARWNNQPPTEANAQLLGVAFSPDGQRLVACYYPEKGFHLGTIAAADPLTFHPAECQEGSSVAWPTADTILFFHFDGYTPFGVRAAKFGASVRRDSLKYWITPQLTPEGHFVGRADTPPRHFPVDPKTLKPVAGETLPTPGWIAPRCLAVSRTAVAVSGGNSVFVYDRKTGKPTTGTEDRQPANPGGELIFRPSADGKRLVTSQRNSDDRSVRVWDTSTGQLIDHLTPGSGWYEGWWSSGISTVSPTARWIASGESPAHELTVWDVTAGKPVLRVKHPNPPERSERGGSRGAFEPVGFPSDTELWVLDRPAGEFRLLELPSGKVRRTVAGFKDVWHACLSPDGKRLAASGWEGVAVRSLDPDAKWEVLHPFKREDREHWEGEWCGNGMGLLPHPPRIGFSPTGEIVTDRFGVVQLPKHADIPPRALPAWVDARGPHEIGFGVKYHSPDGRRRYAPPDRHAEPMSSVVVTEVATDRVLGRLPVPCTGGLAVSPDGTRLFTSNADSTISVWDLPVLEAKYLSVGPVDHYWAALASADPTVGYSAVRRLAADPKSVEWLRECYSQPRATVPRAFHPYQPWAGLTLDQVRDVRAVEVLERVGTAEAKDLLGTWVKHESAVLRLEAAAALARLGQKR